ncbi:DUF5682 family protein [Saccharibacillus sp. CPCC 101409]|uniref:DUF5682 family protein n=1 Tax=Saccharibacillus sp. CPCC 101409 TaxID=3058041 RepID=UPI00267419A7|nr:DUF5682 family protein [Saccharibacillus sp. CPCC 101409]MDO3409869.1 DUF5682 family protein [Saccharibacillus sp. CPCC 101409]
MERVPGQRHEETGIGVARIVSGVHGDERVKTAEDVQVSVFGVRHLSPGGARHLLEYLDRVQPTAVLIEGPSDATDMIGDLVHPSTVPPVAVLAFTDDMPVRTALWPFAVYSPELQAMRWAAKHRALCQLIDLPSGAALALQDLRRRSEEERSGRKGGAEEAAPDSAAAGEEAAADRADEAEGGSGLPASGETPAAEPEGEEELEPGGAGGRSVYERIAELAGEHDYETYWERHYEHNANPDTYRESILAFSAEMRSLGEERERAEQPQEHAYNHVREAYMRRRILAAVEAGHDPEKIVVVCGAYHAAALERPAGGAMTDEELAALPSRGSKLTLMPYSYYRLSSLSGYGAGNGAPHYFQLMWEAIEAGKPDELPRLYLSTAARNLRAAGTHRSTAEVIEAVRLAEGLASLHGGSAPTLLELRDAAQTLLGRGELSVVAESLARVDIGTEIGSLAEGVSQTPLQDDLNRELKRLKLTRYKTAVATDLSLDLRENRRVSSEEAAFLDLNRSFLFHRLALLEIPFVHAKPGGGERAIWAEDWVIQWTPEAEIRVVESTLLGETIEVACAYKLREKLEACASIAQASALIGVAVRCGMTAQMEDGRRVLQALAADSRDVAQIAAAAASLAGVIAYGDIRRADTAPLVPLLEQLFYRGCLYLSDAANCSDEAAYGMVDAMSDLNRIAQEHDDAVDAPLWAQELSGLSERDDRNPKLSGFACALLLERGEMDAQRCAEEVSRRLSPGIPADLGAGWFEGLSMRNRYALLSRMSLWEQLNDYINSLDNDEFKRALVFLRRAFSSFSPHEKTMIAETLGELWGVSGEQAAEILTGDLKEEEDKMLDELNDFDFGDF